jgi:hypothetical protein
MPAIESRMDMDFSAFESVGRQTGFATHPLVRQVMRLPLSLVVAGIGLLPPRFAASARPDAPSGASNRGF